MVTRTRAKSSSGLRLFGEYNDTVITKALGILEIIILAYWCHWITTIEPSGSHAYDVATFYFRMIIIPALIIWGDVLYKGATNEKFFTWIGAGSVLRAMLAMVGALLVFSVVNFGLNLSFAGLPEDPGGVFLGFSGVNLFWFIVLVGPRVEETFRNTLTPTLISIGERVAEHLGYKSPAINFLLGIIVVFFVIAPAFALFHWYAYYSVANITGVPLISLMAVAYIYSVIFSFGNYFFRSDEFSKFLHMLHNLLGYVRRYGIPEIPLWQFAVLGIFLFVMLASFVTVSISQLSKYRREGGIRVAI